LSRSTVSLRCLTTNSSLAAYPFLPASSWRIGLKPFPLPGHGAEDISEVSRFCTSRRYGHKLLCYSSLCPSFPTPTATVVSASHRSPRRWPSSAQSTAADESGGRFARRRKSLVLTVLHRNIRRLLHGCRPNCRRNPR
jgi:hypothetical protein